MKKGIEQPTEPFPAAEKISTLLALPLEGEIQPKQDEDFIPSTSSLTEEIKKVQSRTSYKKLYRMVHNSKNL